MLIPSQKKYTNLFIIARIFVLSLSISYLLYKNKALNQQNFTKIYGKTESVIVNDHEKCLDQIDIDAKIPKKRVCYDRLQHTSYLSCDFNVEPGDTTLYTLVVGSSVPAARIFIEMLKDHNIKYREIASRGQFDVESEYTSYFLDLFRINYIFDFTRPNNYSVLTKCAKQGLTRLIHLVSKPVDNSTVDQLIIPKVFGPYYYHRNPPPVYKKVLNILEGKKDNTDEGDDSMYCSASQVADYLFNTYYQGNYRESGVVRYRFPQFSAKEIIEMASGKAEKVHEFIKRDFYYIKQLNKHPDVPYASLAIIVTDHKNILDRVNKITKLYEKVLPLYRDLSLEIIYIYVKTNPGSDSFESQVKFGPIMRKIVKIYTLQYDQYIKMIPIMNITSVPDYFLRNFGYRISKGEYIFTGSGDFLPSPYFFDAVSRKFLVSSQLLLSTRVDYNDTSEDDYIVSNYGKFQPLEKIDILGGDWNDAWSFSTWMLKNWGDLQGSHRFVVEKLKGFVNDKYSFHVDSIFAIDQASFKIVPQVYTMPPGYHAHHQLVSQWINVFPLYESMKYLDAFCQGKSTLYFKELQRPNWGYEYESERGSVKLKLQNNHEISVESSII
ncbi:hypothetical protein TVAG_297250 [Trichomonas vaginalis G3]|uniref:Uncharacterized protein n=1 Tax=Trichomonas vaginalis (strain ATCC PRA-98 / G3) TaxID=412133 RepID=A2DRC0_TRIV3|nr:hypothetical protein TVAGG3_0512910 [Trichomonas vaginalis G3]EAY17046.1 hypothetical protein TVAG_297250 [Trichomonas vaginalis G3]KAI5517914.1 hypothetical protein TVAGG3_0512910 [Trichomonas vaginalis G3]|eukprot:XP_001329269.1 hypothetical protein [Trichomonas vaginalis G3]